jgi:hypothetical protein
MQVRVRFDGTNGPPAQTCWVDCWLAATWDEGRHPGLEILSDAMTTEQLIERLDASDAKVSGARLTGGPYDL